jgi:UDP-N-acetylmuramoylalanine--D-glutamate ligase
MEIRGSTVLVVGMAKSGLAAAQLLSKQGAHVIGCDTKPMAEIPASLEAFRIQSPTAFEAVDLVVLSPGVPLEVVPAGLSVPVIGELELAARFLRGPNIGITGSNGKTTTTSMVFHILRESGIPCQLGGNIGTPPTAMIDESREDQWNVLELSSFQLETIHEFRAHIGVCLNVTPDHLDRHRTLAGYAGAKKRLFETQTNKDYAVLNADDTICSSYAAQAAGKIVWFSLRKPAGWWLDGDILRYESGILMEAREIPVRGRHNVENTLAAAAASHLAGATPAQIRSAVTNFRAVEHRLE